LKKKTPDKNEPRGEGGGSVGGILSGLAGLVEKLNELAETGAELRRGGEIRGTGKGLKGIYGFTVKVGLGDEAARVEPFGNIRADKATGQATGSLPSGAPGEENEIITNAVAHADSNREKNGLGKLVLTLMKVLHDFLQRQALRRMEGGALTPAQIERLGVTLINQAREIERLRKDFGLPEEDLNLDLGPLGKLL
jgi:hypothetical protein